MWVLCYFVFCGVALVSRRTRGNARVVPFECAHDAVCRYSILGAPPFAAAAATFAAAATLAAALLLLALLLLLPLLFLSLHFLLLLQEWLKRVLKEAAESESAVTNGRIFTLGWGRRGGSKGDEARRSCSLDSRPTPSENDVMVSYGL